MREVALGAVSAYVRRLAAASPALVHASGLSPKLSPKLASKIRASVLNAWANINRAGDTKNTI